MKPSMPKTSFAMSLSGSAKETELRIRNIFQWKKKRPPVIALVAALLVVVFCGSLIGFTTTPRSGTLGEVYQEYFAENPTNQISYDNKDAMAYPSLDPESENFGAALEYVRSMELRSVLGGKKYIDDFNSRDGAISLRGTNGQGLEIDMYPVAGYVVVSKGNDGMVPSGEDARVYQWDETFDVELFLSYLAAELPEEESQEEIADEPASEEPVVSETANDTQAGEDKPQNATSAEPVDGYQRNGRLATIDGISHMPLDELPQEVLDNLTLVSEGDFDGFYPAEWGYRRTYTAPGLEITTTAPSAAYLEWREEVDKNNRTVFPTEADFYAYIEGEEGREWLVNATITDDKYATLDGLRVGMTCAQAEALGYSLHEGQNQIGNTEVELVIVVENDTVVQMRTWWTMGRYIGKFFEL